MIKTVAMFCQFLPKVGILITDGRSNYGYDVRSAAKQVKDAGISMFVIGIGSNLNRAELRAVASDPDDEHLFYFGFNDLSAFVDQMSTTSCDGKSIFLFSDLFLSSLRHIH